MTVGTEIVDERVSVPYSIDGVPSGSFLSGKYVSKSWAGGDGNIIFSPKGKVRVYTTLDRKTGKVVKRRFKERAPKRSRSREPHSYEMSSFKFEAKPWHSFNSYTVNGTPLTQTLDNYSQPVANPLLPPLPDWTANDDIKLIQKLKERSRGSDFNASIFLAQGNEALHMIGDSAIRIARSILLLKKGNVIGAIHEMSKSALQTERIKRHIPRRLWSVNLRRQGSRQLSSNWLELQYGWMPLLQDIRSGSELLADKLNVPFRTKVVARHSVKNDKMTANQSWGWAEGYAIYSKQIIAYFSEPESIPKLLGLTDPASVAWEVLPFSFVADWFVPVGDFLDARAYVSDLQGTFVSTTFTRQRWSGITGKSYENTSQGIAGYTAVSGGSYFCDSAHMVRSVGSSLSVPPPNYKGFGKAASWQHCANGLALLAQVAGVHLRNPP